MCDLYSITHGQEAIRRLFRVTRDLTGNPPALPAVYPNTMAPVVRVTRDGERELNDALGLFVHRSNVDRVPAARSDGQRAATRMNATWWHSVRCRRLDRLPYLP